MSRLDRLIKAEVALGQVIAHLDAAGETDLANIFRARESEVLDLQDAEPCADPDPYLTALEAE